MDFLRNLFSFRKGGKGRRERSREIRNNEGGDGNVPPVEIRQVYVRDEPEPEDAEAREEQTMPTNAEVLDWVNDSPSRDELMEAVKAYEGTVKAEATVAQLQDQLRRLIARRRMSDVAPFTPLGIEPEQPTPAALQTDQPSFEQQVQAMLREFEQHQQEQFQQALNDFRQQADRRINEIRQSSSPPTPAPTPTQPTRTETRTETQTPTGQVTETTKEVKKDKKPWWKY